MKNVKCFFAACIVMMLVLSGCSNVFNNDIPEPDLSIPKGLGALQISFAQGAARTAMPNVMIDNFYHIGFFLSRWGTAAYPIEPPQNGVIFLDAGAYRLTVRAYMGPDMLAAEGSNAFEIIAGQNTAITVDMHPIVSEGYGQFEFDISFPNSAQVNTFTLSRMAGGHTIDLLEYFNTTNLRSGRLDSVPVGFYLLELRLRDGINRYAGRVEVVHIYRNLVTRITREDFSFTHFYSSNSFTVSNAVEWNNVVDLLRLVSHDQIVGPLFTINITNSFSDANPLRLGFFDGTGFHVTIIGGGHTLSSGIDSLFDIRGNYTLVIQDLNLVSRNVGRSVVGSGASFIMRGSASLSGNTVLLSNDAIFAMYDDTNVSVTATGGIAVTVGNNSTFTMHDRASVSGNIPTAGVRVTGHSTFTMHDDASISVNTTINLNSHTGNGVRVDNNSTFTMYDSTSVSGNGNGVRVDSNSTFTMHDSASVFGNTNNGVRVIGATFIKTGGTIIDNSIVDGGTLGGGGVSVLGGGTFIMDGGEISNNSAHPRGILPVGISMVSGGGVSVSGGGTFTMNGGVISNNTAISNCNSFSRGGGVSVSGDGTFIMNGGVVSGNTADHGGGVWVEWAGNSTFNMSGGLITGNTANSGGGGVWVGGIFTKTGGTITGYDSNQPNSNVVQNEYGAILSNLGHAVLADSLHLEVTRQREFTSGPTLNMEFNGRTGAYSGAWELNLDVDGSIDTVKLSWSTFPGATVYHVYRAPRADSNTFGITGRIGTTANTEFEDDLNLLQNRTYFYKVFAYNNGVRIARTVFPTGGSLVDVFARRFENSNDGIEIVWRGCIFEASGQHILSNANNITSLLTGIVVGKWTFGLVNIYPSIVLSYRVQRRSEHQSDNDFITVHESRERRHRAPHLSLTGGVHNYLHDAANMVAHMWSHYVFDATVRNPSFVDFADVFPYLTRGTTYHYRISLTKRLRITVTIGRGVFSISRTLMDTRITGNVAHGGTHRVYARLY